eukprot:Em0494g1a
MNLNILHDSILTCGVVYNHDEASLLSNGFVKCYDQPYSYGTSSYDFSSCNGYINFVGAKTSSSATTFAVGAFGLYTIFSTTTSTTTATYDLGGAYWYFYPSYSFGFADVSSVTLNECDVASSPDCTSRLCWHMDLGVGGYRAGCTLGLNSDATWRKVVYTGSKMFSCYPDTNECATNNGNCAQTCINSIGTYTCSCNIGYTLNADGRTCADINECSTNSGGCAQGCINTVGSYYCSCNAGYSLNADGRTCSDVNECATNNGGCSQTCTNTVGSFTCSCRTGYTLSGDGRTCADINECATNNGNCAQVCINTVGSYSCSCNTGYTLNADSRTCS